MGKTSAGLRFLFLSNPTRLKDVLELNPIIGLPQLNLNGLHQNLNLPNLQGHRHHGLTNLDLAPRNPTTEIELRLRRSLRRLS